MSSSLCVIVANIPLIYLSCAKQPRYVTAVTLPSVLQGSSCFCTATAQATSTVNVHFSALWAAWLLMRFCHTRTTLDLKFFCAFLHVHMYIYTYRVNCSSFHYHASLQNIWARPQGSLPIKHHKLRMIQAVSNMNEEVVRKNQHVFSKGKRCLSTLIALKKEKTGSADEG